MFLDKYSQCKLDLRSLVYHKRDEYAEGYTSNNLMDTALTEPLAPPSDWKPHGILVAHIHEHKDAIPR